MHISRLSDTEAIHEAFKELDMMNVVLCTLPDDRIRLDRTRLANLGYILLYNGIEPVFTRISDFEYMYNPMIYLDDTIPRDSLRSYVISKVKAERFSP